LRSALESLDKVPDGDLRRQLHAIAAHDVQRIDRLVTEIAYASRIDAELSRTTFEPVDLLALATALVGRDRRGATAIAASSSTTRARRPGRGGRSGAAGTGV
jgi:two-component system sensor histidine kinase ChvG